MFICARESFLICDSAGERVWKDCPPTVGVFYDSNCILDIILRHIIIVIKLSKLWKYIIIFGFGQFILRSL